MTQGSQGNIPGRGVPEGNIGVILQRGGEELLLSKAGDRFTLSLASPDAEFPSQIPALRHQAIPQTKLVEVVVEPSHLEEAIATARRLETVAFASHAYQSEQNPETLVYLTDEVVLQFAREVGERERSAIAAQFSLQLVQPVEGIENTFVYQLTPQSRENPIKIANRLAGRPQILTAEANVIIPQESFYRPRDEFYSQQWYLYNRGSSQVHRNAHIDAEKAWDLTRGLRSVVVAITDDAIDINHPDFQGEGKIVAPRDFKGRDFLPLPETSQESHGTACAGVAVAEENGQGIAGVAPGCALMPLRTTGFLDDRSIEDLFNWAVEKGASVISCSWGAASVRFPLSLRQRAAIQRAATQGREGKGCVVVFAAGNANRPVNGTIYERNWTRNILRGPTEWLSGFAAHPDVIAVSACTSLNQKSAYSNWGTHISVCAPSNNAPPGVWFAETGFISTAPPVRSPLPGLGIFTTDRLGRLGYSTGDFTRNFGGTSSACPVVAGVAALVLSANPDLTSQEVREILQQSADKIVDRNRDPQLGLQMGTYDQNSHSQWFGYGKVNAFQAVQAAQQKRQDRQSASRSIQGSNTGAIAIPDSDPRGATSRIKIAENALVKDIQVEVEIEHEFLGDLDLYLRPPNQRAILLQNRTLGARTYLQATYSLQTTPTLARALNRPTRGYWELWAVDRAKGDTGRIKGWQLTLGI